MLPPTRRTSTFRSLTTITNRSACFVALAALIAVAVTALAANSSSASSLSRSLFARATSIVAGGGASSDVNAVHAEHAFETEAAVEAGSSTMATERRGHTATRLADGRVLIAGGENASGALNQTEIYDPVAATFTAAGNMNEARVDHSATLLGDGRVLIIGGRNGAGSVASTEIFDPATGAFTSGPSMTSARAGHSATLLADGRILFVGGNANGPAEIFDASLSGSTAVGSLGVARSMHSAALLQDGRVLIIGGRDSDGNELASGEIFDTPAGIFSTIDSSLKVARVRPLLRVLFDGKVQIIGGNGDESMEIYDPLVGTIGAYAHLLPETDTCTGLKSGILSAPTRAGLFHNGQADELLDRSGHTITELNGNQALVLGGINSSSVILNSSAILGSSPASITADKLDYLPGDTATITGRRFQPGETVRVKIHEDPHTPQERGFDAVADADGNFSGTYLVMDNDLAMKFIVSARGLTSNWSTHTTFTDGNINVTGTVTSTATGLPIAGANVFCTSNCSGSTTTNGAGNYNLNLTFPTNGPIVVTISATATGFSQGFLSFVVNQGTNQNNRNFALTPVIRSTNTIVSCSPNPTAVGQGSTCTTTVNDTNGAGATPPLGTVNLISGGTGNFTPAASCSLSPVSGSASNCSVTYTPTQRGTGTHNITSTYTGSSTHSGSTSAPFPLTVNKRDTLTTVSSSLNPSTFGQSVTFSATVVGTGAGAGNPTGGLVQFKIDGVNFGGPVPLSAGSASSGATSSLSAGNHTVEAVFTSTDANFNNSSDLLDGGQTVNKRDTLTTVSSSLNPSTFGESVSFTATVVGTGAGAGNPSGGSVQFKIDGSDFGAPVALVGGSASSGSTNTLSAGNHTVEAVFTSADTNFNNSNDLLDGGQTVNKRDTLTTVSSSLNPSTFGESVSFTATVVGTGAGAGNPSGGSVQFKIDGSDFGAPVALVGGSASSGSTNTLSAGNHTVEAVFTSADTNFNNSNDLLDGGQTVNKRDTLTTVSSSLNPSTFGESVSFTATVVGTGAGAGNPSSGSVQFKIDGSDFGAPVALVGGSASSGSTNTLSAGNHTVQAVFTSADTNFNDSNDLLDGGQTVNKAPLTITASSHSIIFNDAVPTITASYTGFVLGEGPSNLTTQPTCSTTYTVGSLIGTYPTKCENAVSSNYEISYVNGTVTVLTACSAFNGFLLPIGGAVENLNGGSFANPVRSFKLNSTIPVKFSAMCFGAPLTTGIHTLQAIKYSSATTYGDAIDATPTDAATTGNQFRLTDGEWHFNLNTKGFGANGQGTWLLRATLFDGSSYTVWVSIKK